MREADRSLYESHPDLGLLLTQGPAVIEAALDDSTTLQSDVRPIQVRFVPGKSVVVQYSTSTSTQGDEARPETFVASTGQDIPDVVPVVSHRETDVSVWRAQDDPFLPGLRSVSSRGSAGRLIEQLGIVARDVTLRRRAYRPGRRAVVEISTSSDRIFAKVVRPSRIEKLHTLHTSLAGHAPIPMSVGWSEDSGIAMLQALDGPTLREALSSREQSLPGAGGLVRLLGLMEHAHGSHRARSSLVQRARGHADLIGTIAPELSQRALLLVQAIEEAAVPEVRRMIHGDFHASQILVDGGIVTGLVDIDTVGLGERTDDMANFLGHLDALASSRSQLKDPIASYSANIMRGFDSTTDPRQLRLRVAASVLGYTTGPFRVQENEWRAATEVRLARAEHWLSAALTPGS